MAQLRNTARLLSVWNCGKGFSAKLTAHICFEKPTLVSRCVQGFGAWPRWWYIVLALATRRCNSVAHEDILATKVWLDQHVFNMTLKTTTLPNGAKAWMMSEEKAKERGLEEWPPNIWPTLCFLGLGASSIEYVVSLAQLVPELQLVLLDAPDDSWLHTLEELLGADHSRVEHGQIEDFAEARGSTRRTCQAISWSVDTPPFSFYKYRELFYSSPFMLALFNMQGCTIDTRTDSVDKYYCEYLYSQFQTTLCGRLSENKSADYNGEEVYFPMVDTGCGVNVCMCSAHADAFVDFHFENLCRAGEEHRFMGQWGQDRFLLDNVFHADKRQGRGFYVDVGASHPYHLSNTAYFDLCLGWRGICIEPNPRSRPVLQSLRSCEVVTSCAWANATTMRFANRAELAERTQDETLLPSTPYEMVVADTADVAGSTYFEATCAPLHDLMLGALPVELRGGSRYRPVVDVLSVDAEGAEVEIFRNFPFDVWDIHAIVVETSRRTSMAIDGLLLPRGFLKVAVLGKDAVYVSRVRAGALPPRGAIVPERILWNEPGSESDTIEYMRFQRLFGVDGDLDVDVGDQRLQNETELERQAERLSARNEANMVEVLNAARQATVGGVLTDAKRIRMEDPDVQQALRDPKVKTAMAMLLSDVDGSGQATFLQLLETSARLKAMIVNLLSARVFVHDGVASALGLQLTTL
mmetsp:Transcript_96303/g.272259  ORF Transcript_96303/g.272259 Transcript_96303/m.272259 type:complete len:694 (-) Transcript_96303:26-2107(-)